MRIQLLSDHFAEISNSLGPLLKVYLYLIELSAYSWKQVKWNLQVITFDTIPHRVNKQDQDTLILYILLYTWPGYCFFFFFFLLLPHVTVHTSLKIEHC